MDALSDMWELLNDQQKATLRDSLFKPYRVPGLGGRWQSVKGRDPPGAYRNQYSGLRKSGGKGIKKRPGRPTFRPGKRPKLQLRYALKGWTGKRSGWYRGKKKMPSKSWWIVKAKRGSKSYHK